MHAVLAGNVVGQRSADPDPQHPMKQVIIYHVLCLRTVLI